MNCKTCKRRLFKEGSIRKQECFICRKKEVETPYNGHTQYPNYGSLTEANHDLCI